MDRNKALGLLGWLRVLSLSARRAWIEIFCDVSLNYKEVLSLSARRAWIEIAPEENTTQKAKGRSPQGERG